MQKQADPVEDICFVMGIGTGVAGLKKAIARGATYIGLGTTVGCYLYTRAQEVTPAQMKAAMERYYRDYMALSPIERFEELGYLCLKKDDGGGGGGTDSQGKIGGRTISMNDVVYSCRTIRD